MTIAQIIVQEIFYVKEMPLVKINRCASAGVLAKCMLPGNLLLYSNNTSNTNMKSFL